MTRALMITLATALLFPAASLLAQAEFPIRATIRGENIWLRAEPAEGAAVLAYLQRGDRIQITGELQPGDGDAFYPVDVIQTGESGWVRELAVDPRCLTSDRTLPEVVVDEPLAESNRVSPNRRDRNVDAPVPVPSGELDCEDFSTQAEAQAYFDAQGWSATNDPYRLDQGGVPGVPCESLP